MTSKKTLVRLAAVGGLFLPLAISILVFRNSDQSPVPPAPSAGTTVTATRQDAPPVSALSDRTIFRPLQVVRASSNHEWTADDAMDSKVIERIAHNPDEFIRMVEENERIKRRQLVYRKETVPMLLERIQGTDGMLKSFTLPGLDGREVEVEVTEVHLMNGSNGGCVNGRVKGHFNSIVSVGFSNGSESFNVISPDEGLFLTADAREPGEVFVKEIDPNVYGRPPESNTPCAIFAENLGPGRNNAPSPSK